MKQEIYKSERHFKLTDTLVSHGQLLLRSSKNKEEKDNIDIVFFNTVFIQISNRLESIVIRKIEPYENLIHYKAVSEYLSFDNNNLFEIESNGDIYYIAASFVRVFENQLDSNETSLNFTNKGREKEIARSIN